MTRPSPTVSLETTYKEGYCRLPIPVVAAHVGDERGGEGGEQSGAGQGGRRAVGQDGGGDQGRAGQQHRGDGRGDLPVVADDEVVPEAGEALDAPEEGRGRTGVAPTSHLLRDLGARRRPRHRCLAVRGGEGTHQRAAEQEPDDQQREDGEIAAGPFQALPAGRTMPSPSTDQKVPKVASSRPTPYFRLFSGMRASGRWASAPPPGRPRPGRRTPRPRRGAP